MNHHYEASDHVAATPADVFDRLDDQTRLGEHMVKPSAMMGGGKMTFTFDEGRGQAVGSHIRMGGEAFGLKLAVDEVVTERQPPSRKVWKTVGATDLLVIDQYEMGFGLEPEGPGSRLRVWIDYTLPPNAVAAFASAPLAAIYAHWCVDRMVQDSRAFFEKQKDQVATASITLGSATVIGSR